MTEALSNVCQRKSGVLDSAAWGSLWAFWILGFADISADYIFVFGFEYRRLVPEIASLIAQVTTGLLAVVVLIGLANLLTGRARYRAGRHVGLFLALFAASTVFGVAIGLLKGLKPSYVLDDGRNLMIYFTIFALTDINSERRLRSIRRLFLVACGVLAAKLLLGMASGLLLGEGLGWRLLLRLSFFFAPMLFIGLCLYSYSKNFRRRARYLGILLLGAIGVFAAQMRGVFMGTAAGFIFLLTFFLRGRRLIRVVFASVILLCLGLGLGVAMQGDVTKAFGRWEEADRKVGVEYRLGQTDHLLSVFKENWIAGAGLGYYDPEYEGHADWLPRPYLLELEYLNLLAKLGLVGFGMLAAAFMCLLTACIGMGRRTGNPEHRALIAGLSAGLVALMVASITNTGYSSAYFHAYVALILLSLSALRYLARHARPRHAVPAP